MGMRVHRIFTCWQWFHRDGSRCHTPHDQCNREHLPPVLGWKDESDNLVVTLGLNALLDNTFNAAAGSVNWYVGLVDNSGFSAYAAGNTMASHSGWAESVVYSNATRPAWTKNGAASGGAMSNSSSKASFTINNTATIRGSFLTSDNVKSGTDGTLFGAADFTGGNRSVVSGDTLNGQIDLSVTAA